MKLKNRRQHFVRRVTWTFGLVLLPFACYGLVVPNSLMHHPGGSRLVVDTFTRAIQTADWQTASACYPGTSEVRAELASQLDFPNYGPLNGLGFSRSANYYLPFTGEHEVYIYALHQERHAAQMKVDVVAAGQTWKIDSVRLSPAE